MSDLPFVNTLNFQYQTRASMLEGLDPDDRAAAGENRDRELEDYLGTLDTKVTTAVDETAGIASGTVNVTVSASATGTVDVTFPDPFTTTPTVVVSANNVLFNAIARNQDENGFTVDVRHLDNTASTVTVTVDWIARV